MSWIADLAGKAETLLNKIDQNAASVLQHQQQQQTTQSFPKTTNDVEKKTSPLKLKSTFKYQAIPIKSAQKLDSNDLVRNSSKPNLELLIDNTTSSNISSRRSSVNSKIDLNFDEKTIGITSTNQELAAFKIALAEIKSERDELREEVSILQEEFANKSTIVQELQLQIEEASKEQDELSENLKKLTESNNVSNKTISELEIRLSNITHNYIELNEKYQWQTKAINLKQTELEDYRKKAQSTLQQKDKRIEELVNKQFTNQNDNKSEEYQNYEFIKCEYENLKQENLLKSNEHHQLLIDFENSKVFSEKLQFQLNQLQNEYDTQINLMKTNLKIEINKSEQLESEVKILNQEILAIRQENNKQHQLLLNQLHNKEQELIKEKTMQEKRMSSGISDGNNLEMRMRTLTQALVEKQSAIEIITADKNAMRLQVEKIQDQLKHVIAENRLQRNNQVINVNDTDDAKASVPFIMRENPFDTRVTRRVKRAYSSLDYLGYRIGIFLRRFPLARVLIIIYIAFLHLLVMFVLFSSTPT